MNYLRLSKRDVRYLDGIYKIGNILAISPGYNFEKDVILFPRLTKIYGFLATMGLLALEIMTMSDKFHYFNYTKLTSTKVVSFINSSFLLALVISMILSSCVYNQQSWTTLNKNFQYVDKQLNNRNTTSKKFYKTFISSYCYFGFCHNFSNLFCSPIPIVQNVLFPSNLSFL
jgi:hypothetical protein